MLREGEGYFFRVEKELITPDNKRHFVLMRPDKRKLLLPAEIYSDYGITIGRRIWCRVDRINCKGEIYLEPRHPYYREGKAYNFNIEGIESRTDSSGAEVKVFIVLDRYGRSHPVPCGTENTKPHKTIRLVIERISKGKLHFSPPFLKDHIITLNTDQEYEFSVEKITKGLDNEEYFVITDIYGNHHLLSRRYYEYYGFQVGGKLKGKVLKYKDTGEKIIEPINPYYSINDILSMKFTTIDRNKINGTFTLELCDKFGMFHCVETDRIPEGNNVRCRVINIKKGRPILEVL